MSRGGQDEEQEAPDENVLASGNRMSSDSCWMRRQHESASAAFAAYGGYRFTVQRYGSNRWRAAIHCDGESQRRQPGRHLEPLRNRLHGSKLRNDRRNRKIHYACERSQSADYDG